MVFNIVYYVCASISILSQIHMSQSQNEVFNFHNGRDFNLSGSDLAYMTLFDFPEVSSLPFCARFCLLRGLCESLVYNTITGQCTGYIVTDGLDYSLIQAPNNIYIESVDMPEVLCGECAALPCEMHQRCVPTDGSRFCVDLGHCSSPPEHVVSTIIGHHHVKVGCGSSGEKKDSLCFGLDKWTPVDFSCSS